MSDRAAHRLARGLVLHASLGALAVVFAGAGLFLWAARTEISGAVVVGGALAIDGGPRRVQHPDGGVVTRVLAHDEDRVVVGQPLLELDGTALSASFDLVLAQQRDALARQARLAAEAAGKARLPALSGLPAGIAGPEFDALLASQADLIAAHRASLSGQRGRIADQIVQLGHRRDGLAAQRAATESQLGLLAGELEGQARLFESQLVGNARLNDLKRAQIDLRGRLGGLDASLAETAASIAEHRAALAQVDDDWRAAVLKDLQAVRAELVQLAQQRIALEDRLARLVVRAPQAGVIHGSTVATAGGVVTGGETLMMVVPGLDEPTLDLRVSPYDIDKVHPAQAVVVRLTSVDARHSPDLTGRIRSVAPDLSTDARTGIAYYTARAVIDRSALGKLPPGTPLVPGMPVEAFVQTGDRTVLAYLVKPLLDQIDRAFRDD